MCRVQSRAQQRGRGKSVHIHQNQAKYTFLRRSNDAKLVTELVPFPTRNCQIWNFKQTNYGNGNSSWWFRLTQRVPDTKILYLPQNFIPPQNKFLAVPLSTRRTEGLTTTDKCINCLQLGRINITSTHCQTEQWTSVALLSQCRRRTQNRGQAMHTIQTSLSPRQHDTPNDHHQLIRSPTGNGLSRPLLCLVLNAKYQLVLLPEPIHSAVPRKTRPSANIICGRHPSYERHYATPT